jgi:hypothetical protein
MTILEEAAERKTNDEADAELARLQRHAWWPLLKNLHGTIDAASGFEHVAAGAVFDFLGVIPKRRERRLHAVLVAILQHFGWSAVFVVKDGKHTGIVRSFERQPVAPAPVDKAPAVVRAPVPEGPTIKLRGCDIPMSAENDVFVQFVTDVCRVVEQIKSADAVCESYGVEDWQRDVVGNALLDRYVRNACELRIRNGDAPKEYAQHTMPSGMSAMRDVIGDAKTAPRDKIAAAKLVSDVAGGTHGAIGVKSGFNIKIDLGKNADGSRCGINLTDVVLYPRG